VGTLVGQRVAPRFGAETTITLGTGLLAAGGIVMMGALELAPSALSVILPMMIYMIGVGLTLPQAQAAAMMPFPERAGTASSLMGIAQMGTAAAVGIGVSATLGGTGFALAAIIAALGLAATLVFRASREARRDM
jgi:DHA1 family bicyclomycin/chloramphenicol resistance-like MFS transporter